MIFSKRKKLAEEVDTWFREIESTKGIYVERSTFNVICALDSMSKLKEETNEILSKE